MVDKPSPYSLAQEVASAIQNIITINMNINLNFLPAWLLIAISILIFLMSVWQIGKYTNSSEKNKEELLLQGGNFQSVSNSDENEIPNVVREKIAPVDQILRGTALVVDNREKPKKYRSTSFLGQIRLKEYVYPAWFTAGHVIFPDIEEMGPENLQNID